MPRLFCMNLIACDTATSGTGEIDILIGGHRLNILQWYANITSPGLAGLLTIILRWHDGTAPRTQTLASVSLLSTAHAEGVYSFETGDSQGPGTIEFSLTSLLGSPEFHYTVANDVTYLP